MYNYNIIHYAVEDNNIFMLSYQVQGDERKKPQVIL